MGTLGQALVSVPDLATDALLQLCGEILLTGTLSRQPTTLRGGASAGLELLDLLLNPLHILRATEELTLQSTLTLARRISLDISLDRLTQQQEDGATQLSALVGGRVGPRDPATTPTGARLWIPLDTVPRPVSVAVVVTGDGGSPLARPPQREVRRALEAALYHVLRESLRAHPDFDRAKTPVNVLMRRDHLALWLLQAALVEVCAQGPGGPRANDRVKIVRELLPGRPLADLSGDARFALLDRLAEHPRVDPHQRAVLLVLRDTLSYDDPFLDLLRLVHRNYLVVAGLDPSVRDHTVQFELPPSEALEGSVIRSLYERNCRSLDPREHNFTARIQVPLPSNLRQYTLHVRTACAAGERSFNELSLIGAVHFDDHVGRSALDGISTCADELAARLPATGPQLPTSAQVMSMRHVASHAAGALDRLQAIVDRQWQAADELETRWGRASTRTVVQSVRTLRTVIADAAGRLRDAQQLLADLVSGQASPEAIPAQVEQATAALREAARAVDHPALATELVSNELPGQEVARLRIGRSALTARSPRARVLEVWATVSDEARPYGYSAFVPPFSLAMLVYLTGAFLFDAPLWVASVGGHLREAVAGGTPDAVVAVVLLVPAFAMTQFKVPDRWSVAGRLRRMARLFVVVAIATLGGTAVVVATAVGGDGPAAHPHLLLNAFRAAFGIFTLWSLWGVAATWLRRKYSWRPKGLKWLLGVESIAQGHRPGRLRRLLRYDSEAPDAAFDLTRPTVPFPSRRGDR